MMSKLKPLSRIRQNIRNIPQRLLWFVPFSMIGLSLIYFVAGTNFSDMSDHLDQVDIDSTIAAATRSDLEAMVASGHERTVELYAETAKFVRFTSTVTGLAFFSLGVIIIICLLFIRRSYQRKGA